MADPKNHNSIVIPEIFTQQTIPNPLGTSDMPTPLYSYTLAKGLTNHIGTIDGQNPFDYSKPGKLQVEGTKYDSPVPTKPACCNTHRSQRNGPSKCALQRFSQGCHFIEL